MKLSKLITNINGKFIFQQFGISLERRLQVEITTQQVCQKYYEQNKEFALFDILKDLEDSGIVPENERDLAYIIYNTCATLNYYYESHGLKYSNGEFN